MKLQVMKDIQCVMATRAISKISIAEEDQKKTTFVTPWGCFAYRVMPFGLTNAPVTFQRFMNHVF